MLVNRMLTDVLGYYELNDLDHYRRRVDHRQRPDANATRRDRGREDAT